MQRSSPFWTGVTDGSRGTLATTVWHKPRRAFPSLPSSASPVIAERETHQSLYRRPRCFLHNAAFMEFCCHDSLPLHSGTLLWMNNQWDRRRWRDVSVLTCVLTTSALRQSVRGGYSSRLTVKTPAGTLHSLPGDKHTGNVFKHTRGEKYALSLDLITA